MDILRIWGSVAVAALLYAFTLPLSAEAASFEVLPHSSDTSPPPGDAFLSQSADGQTVAGSELFRTVDGRRAAIRWDTGSGVTELDPLTTSDQGVFPSAHAFGVSADGSTLVGEARDEFFHSQAVVWSSDGSIALRTDGLIGINSRAVDVSADGSVIIGIDSPLDPLGPALDGFIWDAENGTRGIKDTVGYSGTLIASALSDDGTTVAGFVEDSIFSLPEAIRWIDGGDLERIGFVEGRDWSRANAISGDGTAIVGESGTDTFNGGSEAFRWTEAGGMEGLGQLTYRISGTTLTRTTNRTVAFGASSDGSVVVGGGELAWVHSDGLGGMVSVQELLVTLGVTGLDGWNLFEAVDVSADGTVITGWGTNSSMGLEDIAWRAVIPEPSMTLLIGLGLGAMSRMRRRRYSI